MSEKGKRERAFPPRHGRVVKKGLIKSAQGRTVEVFVVVRLVGSESDFERTLDVVRRVMGGLDFVVSDAIPLAPANSPSPPRRKSGKNGGRGNHKKK